MSVALMSRSRQNGDEAHGALKIGQLARQAGVTAKAIRFYEAKGLLPRPTRGANGYRLYGPNALETLTFIRQATGLGLTLAEIREIIAIRQGGRPPCAHVHRLLQDKARELDHKLADLIDMRRQIRRSLAAWRRSKPARASVCPHIERRGREARRIAVSR
jgi:MerR family copper efflux transcriptional regulator